MSQATKIEWCDLTWNPVHGCSKVSPGCAHCYAATLSGRYGHTLLPWTPANEADAGMSLRQIAEASHLSVTAVSNIIGPVGRKRGSLDAPVGGEL